MQRLGHVSGRTLIGVAVQQQRRDVDARQHVTQIRFREGSSHGAHTGRMKVTHDRGGLLDDSCRDRVGEQSRQPLGHQLIRREVGLL